MKKFITTISIILSSFILTTSAFGDDHAEPQYGALEGYFCNYNKGKGLSDVLKVAGEWDEWADSNVSVNYSAWVMTPQVNNPQDFPYDYFWLGVADNHEALGTVNDEWMAKGAKIQKKWEAIEVCDSHNLMTGLMARPFQSTTGHAFVQISGCELNDGKTLQDLMVADKQWAKWMDEVGMPGGLLRWLPFAGDSRDSTTDLYSVYLTESMASRGKAHDMMIKGGAAVLQSTYDDVMSCDTPRIYHSTSVGGKNVS
jgi:hypothetical protein